MTIALQVLFSGNIPSQRMAVQEFLALNINMGVNDVNEVHIIIKCIEGENVLFRHPLHNTNRNTFVRTPFTFPRQSVTRYGNAFTENLVLPQPRRLPRGTAANVD